MTIKKLSLLPLIIALSACVNNSSPDDDMYWLKTPFPPIATVVIHDPMAEYEEESIKKYMTEDIVSVKFGTEIPHENSASLDIIPKRMSFLQFDRRSEQLVLNEFKNKPNTKIRHIYKEETELSHHEAIYNIYKVEYDNSDDEIIIMQYLVDYPYYQVNLKYYAQTSAEYNEIFSYRSAVEKVYMPAYDYFMSFKLMYPCFDDEEDEDDEEEENEKSKHML